MDVIGKVLRVTLIADDDPRALTVRAWVAARAYGTETVEIYPGRIRSYPYGSLESVVLHEIVHLAVLRGTEVLYIDKVESRYPVRMYSRIGKPVEVELMHTATQRGREFGLLYQQLAKRAGITMTLRPLDQLAFDGDPSSGKPQLMGLIDVEKLGYDPKLAGSGSELAGRSEKVTPLKRPLNGGWPNREGDASRSSSEGSPEVGRNARNREATLETASAS